MQKGKNLISTSQEKGFKNDFSKYFKKIIVSISFYSLLLFANENKLIALFKI